MSEQRSFTVRRSVTMRTGVDRVHAQIVDFRRWTTWSPWEVLDPEMTRRYTGPASGVGSVYEWSGNRKAGSGRMEITADVPQRVEVAVRFLKPFKSSSLTTFDLEPDEAGTRVTWTMTGPRTPAVRVMGLFTSMDTFIGRDFEKGLERLRTVAESAPSQG